MNQSEPVEIRFAKTYEFGAIQSLLQENGLPLDGFPADTPIIIAAFRDSNLAGCAALEIHGRYGLLRSVAVHANHRGNRLGSSLVKAARQKAEEAGLSRLFLLTETAEQFFPRFGFTPIARTEIPEIVRESIEFTTACADSAIAMHLNLG